MTGLGLTLVLVEHGCGGGSEDRSNDGSRELHLGGLVVEGLMTGNWAKYEGPQGVFISYKSKYSVGSAPSFFKKPD